MAVSLLIMSNYCLAAGLDHTGRQSHQDHPRPPLFIHLSPSSCVTNGKNVAEPLQSRSFTNTHLGFAASRTEPTRDNPLASATQFVFCAFSSISPSCISAECAGRASEGHTAWECWSKWSLFPLLSHSASPGRKPRQIIKNIILVIYCKLFPRLIFSLFSPMSINGFNRHIWCF